MKSLLRNVVALVLALAFHSKAHAAVLQNHLGRWQGDLKISNGPTLKIGADLFVRADGSYWASVASPDQGVYDIPVASVEMAKTSLGATGKVYKEKVAKAG